MQIEVGYSDWAQSVIIPDRNLLDVLRPNHHGPFHDTDSAIRQATEAAAGFLDSTRRVLILVNDATRPTPSGRILSALAPVLRNRAVRVLVSLGAHRPATTDELNAIMGPELRSTSDLVVLQHDSRRKSELALFGHTSRGTEVLFNREIAEAERIIAINSVEPHYFAGFTGGRKSFMPGVAGIEGITQNHNLAADPRSMPLSLAGNPVHEDMTEAAEMIGLPVFSIQTVQDNERRLLSVRFGSLRDSFFAACLDARKVYGLVIRKKADIVLSVLRPPADINLYQSQRAVEFALHALRSPSIHVTVSRCREGIGDEGFVRILKECRHPVEVAGRSPSSQHPGWHKAARLARIMRQTRLYAVTGLDPRVIHSVFMTPFDTAQEAIDAAIRHVGPDAGVYVIPDAAAVVPTFGQ